MKATDICEVFDQCFLVSHNTNLQGNASEPFYLPARDSAKLHTIYFREDFASSALHEVSHWCIAGKARRGQEDFGYWYEHRRDAERQRAFESCEAQPQALEWIFSVAAGLSFCVSCDNFDEEALNFRRFRWQVKAAVEKWLRFGLSERAEIFVRALAFRSGVKDPCNRIHYEGLPN